MKDLYVRLRLWLCWAASWHTPDRSRPWGFDGASAHATCKYCKYTGMIDSQGNLF